MKTPEQLAMKVWMQFYIARIRATKVTTPSSTILASAADSDFEEYTARYNKLAEERKPSGVR